MQTSRRIVTVSIALALGGCTLTLPVRGVVQNTPETFQGTATGHIDGAGELTITTSSGATCRGTFVYVTGRQGEGTFQCSDGRSGPFRFVSTGMRGTGEGDLGGQRITFSFGR